MAVKQVIVIRKDLNMRKGKMVAMGCHASLKVFFDKMIKFEADGESDTIQYSYIATPTVEEWIDGIFTKICLSVDSEQELVDVYNKAKEANLLCSLIEDCGLTEFNGVVTKTAVAIGPAKSEDIDKITGHLKLL